MGQRSLLPTALLLLGVALASVLVFGPLGLGFRWDRAPEVGLACGLLSCGIAAWLRGRPAARPAAPAVVLLSLAAVVLAGPTAGFMMAFGFANGLGALFALTAGAEEGTGGGGVDLSALYLLALAALMALGFVSQARAIARARHAWRRG